MEAPAGLFSFVWLLVILGLVLTYVPPARRAIARGILAPNHLPMRHARWGLGIAAVALIVLIGMIAPAEKQSAPPGSTSEGSRVAQETPAPVASESASGEPSSISKLNGHVTMQQCEVMTDMLRALAHDRDKAVSRQEEIEQVSSYPGIDPLMRALLLQAVDKVYDTGASANDLVNYFMPACEAEVQSK